jgi:small redox-active disulfide protein 2
MKKIQVLGPGCMKCKALAQNAETAAKEMGIEYTIEKVTDFKEMIKLGIMMTPALVVDGQVKSTGKVLSADEIKPLLT